MTPIYQQFIDSVVTPLSNIDGVKFRKGHVRVDADKLRKFPDRLPCVMASYIKDDVLEVGRTKPIARTAVSSLVINSKRKIAIHGIVSSIEDMADDYLEKIEDLLAATKNALRNSNLKFTEVAYILDTEQQSLGLAGFVLFVELTMNENYE